MKEIHISIAYPAILLLVSLFLNGNMFAQGAPRDTIIMHTGWNMIGATQTIDAAKISSSPSGIITSRYFGYTPGSGYEAKNILERGLGYWVKASQEGTIILFDSTSPAFSCRTATVEHSGKTYHTVKIGTQCWLKENLDVGTMILGVLEQTNNYMIEKYCYNNDSANCATYGGLYQWNEAMQYSTSPGSRGICPSGWHIPTFADFLTLAAAVNDDGSALKAIGQGSGAGAGTNTSGFSALLAGYRHYYGATWSLGSIAFFWSSTQYDATSSSYMTLDYYAGGVYMSYYDRSNGYSIRCVED